MKLNIKNKFVYSGIHLLFSFFLVSGVVGLVTFFCYPRPYLSVMGSKNLILTLFFVDACLGPVITFVIYNSEKKWLKFELSMVFLLQLAALAYGGRTLFIGRPVYLVFDTGRFSIVSAYQIPDSVLEKNKYPHLSITGPKLVGARVPTDREERKKYVNAVLKSDHVDLPKLLQYHVPYQSMAGDLQNSMLPLNVLLKRQWAKNLEFAKRNLNQELELARIGEGEVGFIPLIHDRENWSVIIKRADFSVVGIVPIDPFGRCASEKNECFKIF